MLTTWIAYQVAIRLTGWEPDVPLLPMPSDGDVGEVLERPGVGCHNGPARGLRRGGDDQVVCSSGKPLPADGHEKLGMGGGDVEVVGQNRHGLHNVIHERLALSTLPALGQLDADT